MQQQVDDRSVGGLSRVGIVNDDDLLKDSFPEYMGLDQVGVHYLNPVTKGSRNTYLRRAESVILSSADYADARLNLSRALYLDPDNKTAALLMSQLVNEPSVFAQAKTLIRTAMWPTILLKSATPLKVYLVKSTVVQITTHLSCVTTT